MSAHHTHVGRASYHPDGGQLFSRLNCQSLAADEANGFMRLPFAAEALPLRRYDDLGKQPGFAVPGLDSYRTMVDSVTLPGPGIA